MSTIYVVSFAPANDFSGVGGFQWSRVKEEANKIFEEMLAESKEDRGHIVRLLEVETDIENDEEIIDWLDFEYLDAIEFELDPVRQYIPEGTDEDRLPLNRENIL